MRRKLGERVTNVVMMGMGEPLLNYDAVVRALYLMRQTEGVGLGGRRITVSTAGVRSGDSQTRSRGTQRRAGDIAQCDNRRRSGRAHAH